MAEVLEKLAAVNALAGVDLAAWQQEIRQDRQLPDRIS